MALETSKRRAAFHGAREGAVEERGRGQHGPHDGTRTNVLARDATVPTTPTPPRQTGKRREGRPSGRPSLVVMSQPRHTGPDLAQTSRALPHQNMPSLVRHTPPNLA